jgi:hypothetical protein
MKLRISNKCFTAPERRFFAEAFPVLTKRLGISEYKATVELYAGHNPGENGRLGPAGTSQNKRRIFGGKPIREFEMQITRQDRATMLQAFCHEMVHVKQHLIGVLGCGVDKAKRPITLFYNTPLNQSTIPYRDRPWEKEAHERMNPLAIQVAQDMLDNRARERSQG